MDSFKKSSRLWDKTKNMNHHNKLDGRIEIKNSNLYGQVLQGFISSPITQAAGEMEES